jgi:hypothetical protein
MTRVLTHSSATLNSLDHNSIQQGLGSISARRTKRLELPHRPSIVLDLDLALYPRSDMTLKSLSAFLAKAMKLGMRKFKDASEFEIVLEALPKTITTVEKLLNVANLQAVRMETKQKLFFLCFSVKQPRRPQDYSSVHDRLVGKGALGRDTYPALAVALAEGQSK